MLENRTQQIPAHIATLRRAIISRSSLVIAVLLCLAIATAAVAGRPNSLMTWKPLGGDDYVSICYWETVNADQVWTCLDSCPQGTGAICAEFSDPSGLVALTCCIPQYAVGGSDPGACMTNVELVRSDEGPVE